MKKPNERYLPTELLDTNSLKSTFDDFVYYPNEARPDLAEVIMTRVSDEEVCILFCGMQVWLFPDGKYLLECTLGG